MASARFLEAARAIPPPTAATGIVLYRVVRELLHNVVKHARASRVRLELDGDRDLRIELSTGRIAGRLVDATDGSPIRAARVTAERLDAEATPDFLEWFYQEQRRRFVDNVRLRDDCLATLRALRDDGLTVEVALKPTQSEAALQTR